MNQTPGGATMRRGASTSWGSRAAQALQNLVDLKVWTLFEWATWPAYNIERGKHFLAAIRSPRGRPLDSTRFH